jgi:hypothetical protein
VKSMKPRPNHFGGTFTMTDSGYSVSSDGLGPYRSGSSNVRVLSGGVDGAFLLDGTSRGASRSFMVDLNNPVPGDIGIPLGMIKADGVWPGSFVPAGANYRLHIFFLYMNADSTEFTGDIPVGTTVPASTIGLNFYVNGLHHVLQVGPFPWGGLCMAGGTAIYGQGTTVGTISRPTATTWIVDLPAGSVGRLFDNHREDKYAVNRGLYHVSLHFVLQQ